MAEEATMEECRALAETVPGTLMGVAEAASGADGLLASVDSAHRALGIVIRTLRTLPPGPADGELGGKFASACVALEDARPELARLNALDAGAVHVFELYARRALADPDHAMPYTSWRGHIRDAGVFSKDAMETLVGAAAEARAAESMLLMSRFFPVGSLQWRYWRKVARRFAIFGADTAELALDALRRMRDAVVLESFDTRMMLNNG